jgi:hypothetical protein
MRVPSGDTVGGPLLASRKWNSVFGGGRSVDRMAPGSAAFGSAVLPRRAPIPRATSVAAHGSALENLDRTG